jgi:galactokinase
MIPRVKQNQGLGGLVALLEQTTGMFGARLTGAGFGGACVALVAAGQSREIGEGVLAKYGRQGFCGRVLVPGGG